MLWSHSVTTLSAEINDIGLWLSSIETYVLYSFNTELRTTKSNSV